MRKQKAIMRTAHFVLALLIGLQALPARAFESAGGTPATAVETGGASPDELAALKDQIEKQQKQIEALQKAIEEQKITVQKALKAMSAGTATPTAPEAQAESQKLEDIEVVKGEMEAVADSSAQTAQRVTKLEADTAAYQKSNDAKVKQIGNFSFSGDLRLRYEPFLQEGAERHRTRIRARFNITGKLSDEFSGGITLATGTLDDPVSTNQTFTAFLNRKNFGLDKAWVTYKPKYAQFLKIDAGKFAYPWYRTSMTFDNDVNPEGLAETLSFNVKSSVLKNITIVGFQLPINELSSAYDSFILGGQIQSQFQINPKVRLSLYGTSVNFNRVDPIAVAVDGGSLKPSLPNSNTYRYSNGKVVGYATGFSYLNAIGKLDINSNSRFPVMLQLDFVNNTRGSRERSGYWAEAIIGKQSQERDLQFGYSFIRIEKDAVISAFSESDLRSSTNVWDHKLQAVYMLKGNVTAHFTAWIGKLANPHDNISLIPASLRGACTGADTSSCADALLNRLQFDLIYKF
jgi:hypothetical protein